MFVCIGTATGEGSTRVFIVGPDDGRQGLADIARQMSKDIVMRRLLPSDITVSRVDDIIRGNLVFLSLYFLV